MTRLLPLILMACGALLLGGCGSEDIDPEKRLEAWLGEVCDGAAVAKKIDTRDSTTANAGGKPRATAGCERSDETIVEGYEFVEDPTERLVEISDGWESGDGISSVFVVAKLDDGRWATVFAFTEDSDLLDDLTDDADASWKRHSSAD